jgi:hypothetical protein
LGVLAVGKTLLVANIPCLLFGFVAAYLALMDADGWGWFLFAALLLACGPARRKE